MLDDVYCTIVGADSHVARYRSVSERLRRNVLRPETLEIGGWFSRHGAGARREGTVSVCVCRCSLVGSGRIRVFCGGGIGHRRNVRTAELETVRVMGYVQSGWVVEAGLIVMREGGVWRSV